MAQLISYASENVQNVIEHFKTLKISTLFGLFEVFPN